MLLEQLSAFQVNSAWGQLMDFQDGTLPDFVEFTPGTNGGRWDNSSPSVFVQDSSNFEYNPEDNTQLYGLRIEGAATNLITANRDLSGWTLSNVSVGAIVGINASGTPASRLTASDANGTVTKSITGLTSGVEYTLSAQVKRVTGYTRIDITHDNGTTWTEVTGKITGKSNWSTVFYTFYATATSAIVGFRIGADTDVIDVDCVQLETGFMPTSSILTGGATRAADALVVTIGGGTWDFTWTTPSVVAGAKYLAAIRIYTNQYRTEYDWYSPDLDPDNPLVTHEYDAITPVTFTAQAADFSGGVFVESNGDVGVLSDSDEFTLAIGFTTPSSLSGNHYIMELDGRVLLYVRSDGKLQLWLKAVGAATVWTFRMNTVLSTSTRYTFEASYKDGVRAQAELNGGGSLEIETDNGGTVELTRSNLTFGGRSSGGSNPFNGIISAVWMSDVSYDITAATWFDGTDTVDWGTGGAGPTGTAPQIMMLWDDLVEDADWGGTFADGSPTLGDE